MLALRAATTTSSSAARRVQSPYLVKIETQHIRKCGLVGLTLFLHAVLFLQSVNRTPVSLLTPVQDIRQEERKRLLVLIFRPT